VSLLKIAYSQVDEVLHSWLGFLHRSYAPY
jgi:hypothetical protein